MVKAMYVHVPFCDSICAYCDFGRCKMQPQLADRWLTAIERELLKRQLPPQYRRFISAAVHPARFRLNSWILCLLCLMIMLSKQRNTVLKQIRRI